jgi:Holliday junction resolvase-like predicted endonuclease
VSLELRWRGGEVDRLLDRGHADLVGRTVGILERSGWAVATEATYSRYGERGSYDVLALHRRTGIVLAVEVKTRLVSLETTLRKLDEKVRLAPEVAADRFGTRPSAAARMLVLPEGGVARRVAARHDQVLRLSFPLRAASARAWLVDPVSSTGILLLVRPSTVSGPGASVRRASPRGLSLRGAPAPRAGLTLESDSPHRRGPSLGDTRRPPRRPQSPA